VPPGRSVAGEGDGRGVEPGLVDDGVGFAGGLVTEEIRTRHDPPEGDPADDAQISIIDRGGVGRDLVSRVDRDPSLRGSKHLVAVERQPLVTVGRRDRRTVIIVPETKDQQTVGITLLHLKLQEQLDASVARGVLQGYRNRYSGLRDFVTETEPTFREDLLSTIPVADLLVLPITALAEHWAS